MKAIGYARTSTAKQDLSLEVQERRIRLECEIRGYELEMVSEQLSSSVSPIGRLSLDSAFRQLSTGEAQILIVSKLDRLARSISDISTILEHARKEGWSFIALDLGVDTSTPEGTLVVNIMGSIAQWEKARIQERIREALHQARLNGTVLGRPRLHGISAREQAHLLLFSDPSMTLAELATRLHADGISSGKGKPLSASSVRRLLSA
jgi:DNA invertase Pin-like site-specific DNA recombinase